MKKIIILLIFLFLSQGICLGGIYKYKDENGNWRFTDTPMTSPEKMEKVKGVIESDSGGMDIKKKLYDKFNPKNTVEEASLAVMTIKTLAGSGSGFFISQDGYIITNKHVIRGSEKEQERTDAYLKDTDDKMEKYKKNLEIEEDQLKKRKEYLDRYKKHLDSKGDSTAKRTEEARYNIEVDRYNAWEKEFKDRKRDFDSKKSNYEIEKINYKRKVSSAKLSQHFKIILKDNSEHYVYLISVSSNLDLALLKLDRCLTPFLKTAESGGIRQGLKVYAIGSPIGLRDSVSAGVISGFEGGYIKTDAQIYPGNSGGPLINEEGNIVGINTMKQITYKYEGLGFAIPVKTAVMEFSGYLPMSSE